jgi:methylated-DNA-[protein]-cysteine S-methyltransferase
MTASRVFYSTYDSPLGELLLVGDGRSLTGLYMQAQKYAREVQPEWKRDAQPFRAAVEQLDAYFAGELRAFDLSLAPSGTDFQRTVWRALLDVQFGTTATYGELARRIGSPRAPRAVGLANGRNPIGLIVPCHRIIGANGSLTGYGGGIERKRWLLAHEARWSYGLTPVVSAVRASSRAATRSDSARAPVHTRRARSRTS